MTLGRNPGLKRYVGGKRMKDHKVRRLLDDADAGFELGLDQVGIQAPLCIIVVPDRHLIGAPNLEWCDRSGYQLRV